MPPVSTFGPGAYSVSDVNEVTQILEAAQEGDVTAPQRLLPLVYKELRALAAHRMAQEAPGNTLQATALVHEAWLRLLKPEEQARFQNRAHFFLRRRRKRCGVS